MSSPKRPRRPPLTEPDEKPDPLRDPALPEPDRDPGPEPSPEPGRTPGPAPSPEPGPSPGPRPDPGPTARFRVTAKRAALVAGGLVTLLALGWANCGVRGCPDVRVLESYQYGGGPLVLDRDGKPLAHLNPLSRRVVSLSSLPPYLPDAFVAVEDKRFREHDGVDWRRVPGALLANVRAGGYEQGFSTITMQLARNVFPDRLPASDQTLRRKLVEIRVAGQIEDRFTKDEILELYLNHIYFGEGAYGVETAARHYFGKAAADLTLAQAATLAAIPRGPTLYDPRRQPERARARRDLVLSLMAQQGRIDTTQARKATASKLAVLADAPRERDPDGLAPYFLAEVRRELEDRYGSALYYSGRRVETTLDRALQQALEEEIERQARAVERGAYGRFRHPAYAQGKDPGEHTSYLQAAGIVLDAHTGEVLALVGGRDWRQSPFDRALLGRRQVGSAFKPFVYAAAIQRGWMTVDRLDDAPMRIVQAGSPDYEPHNFDGRFSGSVTLRDALVKSLNVPTVQLATRVGLHEVAQMARAAGLTELDETPAMALGTVSASPLQLALAYLPFATLGSTLHETHMIRSIADEDGRELSRTAPPESEEVMSPALAYVVTDMLTDVVNRGTGNGVRAAGYAGVAAGKTGTTSDGKDTWFVGFTPDLVGVIWMGFDQPGTILPGAAGGRLAAPIWGRTMARVYRDRPDAPAWSQPAGVVRLLTDPATGSVVPQGCRVPEARVEVFLSDRVPAEVCPSPPPRDIFDRTWSWLGGIFGRGRRGHGR